MQTVKARKTFEFQCPQCNKINLIAEDKFYGMRSKTGGHGEITYIACGCGQEMVVKKPTE